MATLRGTPAAVNRVCGLRGMVNKRLMAAMTAMILALLASAAPQATGIARAQIVAGARIPAGIRSAPQNPVQQRHVQLLPASQDRKQLIVLYE